MTDKLAELESMRERAAVWLQTCHDVAAEAFQKAERAEQDRQKAAVAYDVWNKAIAIVQEAEGGGADTLRQNEADTAPPPATLAAPGAQGRAAPGHLPNAAHEDVILFGRAAVRASVRSFMCDGYDYGICSVQQLAAETGYPAPDVSRACTALVGDGVLEKVKRGEYRRKAKAETIADPAMPAAATSGTPSGEGGASPSDASNRDDAEDGSAQVAADPFHDFSEAGREAARKGKPSHPDALWSQPKKDAYLQGYHEQLGLSERRGA